MLGTMLFNSFLTDANLDVFNILWYSFDKFTPLYRNELIKICRIS